MTVASDPFIREVARRERAKGRAQVEATMNAWRAEYGMPSCNTERWQRIGESFGEVSRSLFQGFRNLSKAGEELRRFREAAQDERTAQ